MTKRSAILIILLVLVLGTGLLYFLLGGKSGPIDLPNFPGSPFGTPPDESGTGGSTPGGEATTTPGTGTDGKPFPKFYKLSDVPTAGAVSFLKNGSTYVRYVERATGHVYDVNPGTLGRERVANITEPKIIEALWAPDASGYVARAIAEGSDTVRNTSNTLIPPKATSTDSLYTVQSTFLRGGLGEIVVTPNKNLVYASEDSGVVALSTFSGERPKTLFATPFTEWRLLPIDNANAFIFTKAAASAPGYAYKLSLVNGALTKLIGPVFGLTAVPNADGSRLAYFHISNDKGFFSIFNIANGTSFDILPATLPEKCVWSKKSPSLLICGVPKDGLGSDAPDSWYQGVARYSDRIWRFNVETGTAELLLEPEANFNTEIDITKPQLSPDEDYLFFTDKGSLLLWALKL